MNTKTSLTNKVLFIDFDGQFIKAKKEFERNYERYWVSVADASEKLGRPISIEKLKELWDEDQKNGNKSETIIEILVNDLNFHEPSLATETHHVLINKFGHEYEIDHNFVDALLQLPEHKKIIVTHAPEVWIKHWLSRIQRALTIDDIVCIKTIGLCKRSDPKTYPFLLEKYDVNAKNTVMIEDTEANLHLANAINIPAVMYGPKQAEAGYPSFNCPFEMAQHIKEIH
tara:strand:+ start:2024 stop:2707 length:684 start_codon:yes stop_codon:yes gene_type:complete